MLKTLLSLLAVMACVSVSAPTMALDTTSATKDIVFSDHEGDKDHGDEHGDEEHSDDKH